MTGITWVLNDLTLTTTGATGLLYREETLLHANLTCSMTSFTGFNIVRVFRAFTVTGFTWRWCGKEIEIPTLEGRVSLKIPEGTQTGKMFRLRGKGVKPVRTSMQGDLLCRIVIETPVNLTARQRELLKELQETLDGDDHKSSPKKKSFFDRLFD
jgi:hypothetical protein